MNLANMKINNQKITKKDLFQANWRWLCDGYGVAKYVGIMKE